MKMRGYELSEKETMMLDIIAEKTGRSIEDIVTDMIESKLAIVAGSDYVKDIKSGEYREEDFREEFGHNPTRFY